MHHDHTNLIYIRNVYIVSCQQLEPAGSNYSEIECEHHLNT